MAYAKYKAMKDKYLNKVFSERDGKVLLALIGRSIVKFIFYFSYLAIASATCFVSKYC